ncbi:MAG: tRNA-dihydrouridine synthase, partial [Paracoccaceae bacterium]
IGRAARARPWLLAEIAAKLSGTPPPAIPQGAELAQLVARHTSAALDFYGVALGNRVMRKHLGWYMHDAATPPALRREILRECDPDRLLRLLPRALTPTRRLAA